MCHQKDVKLTIDGNITMEIVKKLTYTTIKNETIDKNKTNNTVNVTKRDLRRIKN